MIKKICDLKKVKYLKFIVLIVLCLSFIKKLEFYMFISFCVNISIGLCIIYIHFIRVNFVKKNMFNNMILVNLNLRFNLFLNLIGILFLFGYVKLIYFLFIYSIQCILDFSQLLIIFNLYSKAAKLIINHVIAAIMIINIFILKHAIAHQWISVLYFKINIIIFLLIPLFIMIAGRKNVIDGKEKVSFKGYKKIKMYMIASAGNMIGFLFVAWNLEYITILCLVFNYFIKIDLYNLILNKSLNDSINLIREDIKKAGIEKKNLNRLLKKRNKILYEKNNMIKRNKYRDRKLIESIYDGIYVFQNDKLIETNNVLPLYNLEDNSLEGTQIEIFFREYLDLDYNNYIVLDNKDIRKYPIVKKNGLSYEVYLIRDLGCDKIVYIQDVTYIEENIKLRKQLEKCMEDDERKREFYSNISHELKTPINLIYSAIQLNSLNLKEDNINSFERNRIIINKNCLRLIRTINNFIDANKISEGYIYPDMKIYNIVEVVESIALGCNKYIEAAGIQLIFDADEEEIYTKCDRDMINRIILNILSNYVKYGDNVTFIKFHMCCNNKKVIIKIKSDGKKIDKDIIPYMFDKFTKINKAFNRLKEGSGLGLFLVKALVELQGGKIIFSSNNKGNEFKIIFDMVEDILSDGIFGDSIEMNSIEEKIDIEFSDIYI